MERSANVCRVRRRSIDWFVGWPTDGSDPVRESDGTLLRRSSQDEIEEALDAAGYTPDLFEQEVIRLDFDLLAEWTQAPGRPAVSYKEFSWAWPFLEHVACCGAKPGTDFARLHKRAEEHLQRLNPEFGRARPLTDDQWHKLASNAWQIQEIRQAIVDGIEILDRELAGDVALGQAEAIPPAVRKAERHPRRGKRNPERINNAFWEWMIREGEHPYGAHERLGIEKTWDNPTWTFDRFGSTRTQLADGRVIWVGGEHEDFYDPDFWIYNDVVVLGPVRESVEIYGYPEKVFPPTDFHTATLLGERIILIGRLGYFDKRMPGTTPVLSIDINGYQISEIRTHGDCPGWIFKHEAELDASGGSITVRGGELVVDEGGEQNIVRNLDEYRLHLDEGRWEKLTDHSNWRQFEIAAEERQMHDVSAIFQEDLCVPKNVAIGSRKKVAWNEEVLVVDGVPIRCQRDGLDTLKITIEGDLPPARCAAFVEGLRMNLEQALGQPCKVAER